MLTSLFMFIQINLLWFSKWVIFDRMLRIDRNSIWIVTFLNLFYVLPQPSLSNVPKHHFITSCRRDKLTKNWKIQSKSGNHHFKFTASISLHVSLNNLAFFVHFCDWFCFSFLSEIRIPNTKYRAVVWALAQAHILKWLIDEKMQKMGYFHCIFLIWPTSCEKPNDGPVVQVNFLKRWLKFLELF